jgi:hypothetical protein
MLERNVSLTCQGETRDEYPVRKSLHLVSCMLIRIIESVLMINTVSKAFRVAGCVQLDGYDSLTVDQAPLL